MVGIWQTNAMANTNWLFEGTVETECDGGYANLVFLWNQCHLSMVFQIVDNDSVKSSL